MTPRWPRLLALLILPAALPGSDYSYRVWRTEDGLPQNRIQALAQTPEGYLWVGTPEGLARFDGLRFVVFDRANTPALTDNSILALETASDGALWIGTEGGGLLHYSHGDFHAFGLKDGLTNAFIRAIHLGPSGAIWVGTDRGFFFSNGGAFTRLDNTPEIPLASVTAIAENGAGTVLAATAAGLLEVNAGKLRRIQCGKPPALPAEIVLALLHEGLIPDACANPSFALPAVSVTALHKDALGNFWLGILGQGLLNLDLNHPGARPSLPAVLPGKTVFLLFEDHEHNIWAGAQDGLARISPTAVSTLGAHEGLADDNVSSTYEDPAGRLWLVTFSGEIYRLKGEKPLRYLLPPPFTHLRYRSLLEDRRGDLWFATSGAGVVRLSHGKATAYKQSDGLRSDTIRQIFEDSQGAIWLATSSGISRLLNGAITNYYLEQGLSYPSVHCLAETPEGDILAGTDAGLNRIHDGKIVADPLFASLKQEKVWSIYVDGPAVWLGTRGGGLVLIRNGKLTRITARDGLTGNSIYQIVDDHAGNLWLTGPLGVSSVRRSELDAYVRNQTKVHAVEYGSSDGMATGQMYGGIQPTGVRRASGELWFANVRGAVRIDPAHLHEHHSGPVIVESVSAAGTPLPLTGEIAIPAGRGRLQIDFTACNLVAPQQVSFRYKLENFDDSWTVATRTRSAYYSNLPPGHYRFRVIAENSEASIRIFQPPSFFQSGWFYLLLTIAVLGCIGAGMWIYASQTKARFALLLTERTRLAREMHDTVIQGSVGVSTLLDAAVRLQRTNPAEATRVLAQARVQIGETLDEARKAVWDLRNSSDAPSPTLELLDLAVKLGSDHGVRVDTEIAGDRRPLDPHTERALLLIGREALRNAVLHGQPKRVRVSVTFLITEVRLEVRDDGKGFDSNLDFPNHFGLVGMRERAEQIGGEFELTSQPGQGTRVTVSLPIRNRT